MKTVWISVISLLLVLALIACGRGDAPLETTGTGTVSGTAGTSGGPTTTRPAQSSPVTTAQPPETATTSTDPVTPDPEPSVEQGIFGGLTVSQIWDKVMGNMAASTGLDVSVVSKSDYTVGQERQKEEQNVQILLNATEDSYSYAVETETRRILPDLTYTEKSYQAFKDGWFYQSNCSDETGSPVESSAKIAVAAEKLADQGLDLRTILALNAMVNMGAVTFEGKDLETVFREVTYTGLEDGRSTIVCKGVRADKLLEVLLASIGRESDEISDELAAFGALLSGFAELTECGLELGIAENGMPESIHSSVSLKMKNPIAFSVQTEYTLTVNAIGADAGKVTLPEGVGKYPEYKSIGDYLEKIVGNRT